MQTVGQCEWADYPTQVLAKHWPDVPRWRDIRTLTGESFYERTGLRAVDVISGGFPCQPFSVAGNQKGKGDDRYLWPEMLRVIRDIKPSWVVGENVPGILRIAAADVIADLEREGYNVVVLDFEAAAVGAPHRRERIAFVANREPGVMENAGGSGCGKQDIVLQQPRRTELERGGKVVAHARHDVLERWDADAQGGARQARNEPAPCGGNVADTDAAGLQGGKQSGAHSAIACGGKKRAPRAVGKCDDVDDAVRGGQSGDDGRRKSQEFEDGRARPAQPGLGRAADGFSGGLDRYLDPWAGDWEAGVPRVAQGVPNRVNRIKCLGNAVVPQQFYPIFRAIVQIKEQET